MPTTRLHERRRIAFAATLTLAGAALLTACTPAEDAGTTPTPATSGTAQAAPTGAVDFVWPGTSEPEMAVANGFAAKMAEQGITVNYNFLSWADMQKQLAIRIQAGDPPDLTMTQDVTDLVRMQGLLPLDDLFADSEWEAGDFRPGTLEYSTIDDTLYSIPYSAQAWDLIVNDTMLEEAGLSIDSLDTWAGLEAAAKAMTKGETYGFAYPMQNPRFAFRGAATAGYANDLNIGDTEPANEAKWLELLQHFKNMQPYRPAADTAWAYPEMFRAYASGQVGMIAAGTFFSTNVYALNPDIIANSTQIAYPKGPSADESLAPISNAGFAIFKDSENPELAWYVIEELMKPEWQAQLTTVANSPAMTAVTAADLAGPTKIAFPNAIDGTLQQAADQIELIETAGTPLQHIVGQPAMEPEFTAVMGDYLNGELTKHEAYATIMERFEAVAATS